MQTVPQHIEPAPGEYKSGLVHGEAGPVRRDAVLLHADVENYTGRMGRDETGTFRALKRSFAIFEGEVRRQEGRIVNLAADSILAEFPSCRHAAYCAAQVQAELQGGEQTLPCGTGDGSGEAPDRLDPRGRRHQQARQVARAFDGRITGRRVAGVRPGGDQPRRRVAGPRYR